MSDTEEAPKVYIKGTRPRRSQPKTKSKYSNWLITINTNKRNYKDNNDPDLENDIIMVEETTQKILNNIKNYVKINEENATWSTKLIDNVDARYGVEYSQRAGLHVHVFIRIKHQTRVKLDYEKIKEDFRDTLELDNVYIRANLVRPSAEQNIEEYLEKYF